MTRFFPSPPFAGGEGRVRGAMPESVLYGPLTLPSPPASGGEGTLGTKVLWTNHEKLA